MELYEIFKKNPENIFSGNELIDSFSNVFYEIIRDNTYALIKEKIIIDTTENCNAKYKNKTFKFSPKK